MIDVKRQTRRTTKWHPRFADNINMFYGKKEDDFQLGIVTSTDWDDFTEKSVENPKIEIVINGKDYNMLLSEFKRMVRAHYRQKGANVLRIGFDEFLIKHKAEIEYYRNFAVYSMESFVPNYSFAEYSVATPPHLYISKAFIWENTPEKKPYWERLHDLWQKELESEKN